MQFYLPKCEYIYPKGDEENVGPDVPEEASGGEGGHLLGHGLNQEDGGPP